MKKYFFYERQEKMRKVKILFLMLLGVLGLNSCAALATAGAITYFGGTMLAYGCAEYPDFCNPFPSKPETPEQKEKREEKERKKTEEKKIRDEKKKAEEKEYIQKTILEERKNVEVFEGIQILLPKRLGFRKNKVPVKTDNGYIISRLYDKKTGKDFPQNLYIVKRDEKNLEKIINSGKDEEYEEHYKDNKKKSIEKEVEEYKKLIEEESSLKNYAEQKLKEYKEKQGESFSITNEVEKLNENTYRINEKINEFGQIWNRVTYVKILKDGVYIIGYENSKDIFVGLFGK